MSSLSFRNISKSEKTISVVEVRDDVYAQHVLQYHGCVGWPGASRDTERLGNHTKTVSPSSHNQRPQEDELPACLGHALDDSCTVGNMLFVDETQVNVKTIDQPTKISTTLHSIATSKSVLHHLAILSSIRFPPLDARYLSKLLCATKCNNARISHAARLDTL